MIVSAVRFAQAVLGEVSEIIPLAGDKESTHLHYCVASGREESTHLHYCVASGREESTHSLQTELEVTSLGRSLQNCPEEACPPKFALAKLGGSRLNPAKGCYFFECASKKMFR